MMPPGAAEDVGTHAAHDPRPVVRLPRGGVIGGVIAAGGLVLAAILFLSIESRHDAASGLVRTAPTNAFVDPPPLVIPPEAVPETIADAPPSLAAPRTIVTVAASPPPSYAAPRSPPIAPPIILPVAPASVAQLPVTARRTDDERKEADPIFVVDTGPGNGAEPASRSDAVAGAPSRSGGTASGDDAPAGAASLRNRTDIMPTGTLIPAALETPIDTARPGLVRAIVSQDTRGFDGRRVLVPRGSRLVGEYQSDVRGGQKRVLVTWTRLIRPDGVTMRLGSPAADQLGGAGVPGRVNSFFFQRFAGALLQSALNVGVNLAARPGRGSVIVGLPQSTIGNVGQTLLPTNDLRPKITVKAGAEINVFVARDLDFAGAGSKP